MSPWRLRSPDVTSGRRRREKTYMSDRREARRRRWGSKSGRSLEWVVIPGGSFYMVTGKGERLSLTKCFYSPVLLPEVSSSDGGSGSGLGSASGISVSPFPSPRSESTILFCDTS